MHIPFTSAMYSTAAYTTTNVDDFSLPSSFQPNFTGFVSMRGLSGLDDLRCTLDKAKKTEDEDADADGLRLLMMDLVDSGFCAISFS